MTNIMVLWNEHIADALSCDFHLSWSQLINSLSDFLPQNAGYQLWHPTPQITSAVIMCNSDDDGVNDNNGNEEDDGSD